MRGQTLPMWLGNIALSLVFAFFIGSYGNAIAYQFRAQAAADSIANAAVAIQSQEFNQMIEGLYASGVEEYRIRHLLESIRTVASNSGGCSTFGNPCANVWANLIHGYRRSLYRYDQDARMISSVTSTMDYGQVKADATQLVNQFATACANPTGNIFAYSLDCGPVTSTFHIHLDAITQRKNLGAVKADAQVNLLPSYSVTGASQANLNLFGPLAVEVSVCATVPPIFPQIFGNLGTPTIVVARAAATNAMVEQDWIQPGNSTNPDTQLLYQPTELYGDSDLSGINWYSVNFAGNASRTSYNPADPAQSSIQSNILGEEFSARTGWWAPVPILPFKQISSPSDLGAGCS